MIAIMLFGVFILLIFLFYNARLVYKKEAHTLANSLTLFLGIAIIVHLASAYFIVNFTFPKAIIALYNSLTIGLIVCILHVIVFLTSAFLANFNINRKNKDYIIILGSGLINDQVTPLLASRIDIALKFYYRQQRKTTPPILVFSGGQGADEVIAEAQAMQEYALNKGVPKDHILIEDQSHTTLENMQFSNKVIQQHSKKTKNKCLYATNNYHVFRAGILAKKANLKARGIGARTAFYYLPNAIIREYFAYFWLHKKIYLTFLIIQTILLFLIFLFL
ncbi:YdcF family protein [Erysipelotrichaceae bacterium OttesenSCG-928-M19]|nr:YdcF family protein [Erysipelotrichaceae bacterium OttesenSCG-928-M19]